jgi:diadenosine tetraphosphate (Ap4A) HIT family hydrolase
MTTSNRPDGLFCTLPKDRIVAETALVITLEDGFPVSPGHTLIIPTAELLTWAG